MRKIKYFLPALILLLAGCSFSLKPILNFHNQAIGQNLSIAQIQNSIENAAQGRGWFVSEKSKVKHNAGFYKLTLNIRSHQAVVKVAYNKKQYSIVYISSQHLKYRNGNIHHNYNRWVNNLNHDIHRELSTMILK